MKKSVVIVAGGQGTRMGGDVPKQFLLLNGRPVLMHTIGQFLMYDPGMEVVVVLPADQIGYWQTLIKTFHFNERHHIAIGGENRFYSVKNGLDSLPPCDLIAVHDGVRPLVSVELIERCFNVASRNGSAVPVVTPAESVRFGTFEQSEMLDRSKVLLIQTPQIFNSKWLTESYRNPWNPSFTDDASVVEKKGFPIHLVEGARSNLKITHREDLIMAGLLMDEEQKPS